MNDGRVKITNERKITNCWKKKIIIKMGKKK